MERGVKIASGHGFFCPIQHAAKKERAIFPSALFHAGEKCAFPRNTPPERGSVQK